MTWHVRTRWVVLAAGLASCAGLGLAGGCGRGQRAADVNVSLADLARDEGVDLGAALEEPAAAPAGEEELASFVSEQAAALGQAFANTAPAGGTEAGPEHADPASTDPGAGEEIVSASLSDMLASEGAAGGVAAEAAGGAAVEDVNAEPEAAAAEPTNVTPVDATPVAVSPEVEVDALYDQLQQALGEEIQSTSEPFRSAVALVALAAAQGEDPLAAIGPETPAGARLSPAERSSAETIAQLLGTLLSPEGVEEGRRAEVLERLAGRLTQDIGLRIPTAALCTRVRGFGKYEPFPRTDFLAGRPIRALVYAEVDGFEHRAMDFSQFGSVEVHDKWAVELSEELQLYHVADGRLAWRRPAEKVVETSRNRQRDFYLLAEIELPRTLTVGSYELKVVIKDDVSGAVAEKIIPIGVVADPALAWTAE